MTKVMKSDLSTFDGAKALNDLDPLGTAMKKIGTIMDNFVTYSGRRLKGEGYDAIRTHVDYFAASFSKLGQLDLNTYDNLKENTKTFITFMEEYDELDDSNLEHLSNGLNYTGRQIGNVQSRIYAYNKNSEESNEDINSLNTQLEYWKSKYDEILKDYNKLKELAPTNASTGACLDLIESDTQKFRDVYNTDK